MRFVLRGCRALTGPVSAFQRAQRPVQKGVTFQDRDVFVDYPFEEVMFRWDHQAELIYRCFYGEGEWPEPLPHDNRLFNDALLYGDEIDRQQYDVKARDRSKR